MNDSPTPSGTDVADRLVAATNAHDLDALVACFGDDYVLTNPAHPGRGFSGTAQVRRRDDLIVTGRFFIEPVDDSPVDADVAVRAAVAATR